MDLNTQKELFSYAYVSAVASVAGYSVSVKGRAMDNAGVDVTIEMPEESEGTLFPKCDEQVKCTSSQGKLDRDYIKFPLPVKNYKRLIHPDSLIPIILIVVLVPSDLKSWFNVSEGETIMKKCGYWVSLKGRPPTVNKETITIEILRNNLLTPNSLSSLMKKIANREDL
jgi:Domain of unknown function (DUF4365)